MRQRLFCVLSGNFKLRVVGTRVVVDLGRGLRIRTTVAPWEAVRPRGFFLRCGSVRQLHMRILNSLAVGALSLLSCSVLMPQAQKPQPSESKKPEPVVTKRLFYWGLYCWFGLHGLVRHL